jgi:hypothetical protein
MTPQGILRRETTRKIVSKKEFPARQLAWQDFKEKVMAKSRDHQSRTSLAIQQAPPR